MHADERNAERIARAAAGAAQDGLDAIVVGPSPDLAYLTGYDAMPLERPTLLVLRPEHDPALLVPELERARAVTVLAPVSPVGLALWRSAPSNVIVDVVDGKYRVLGKSYEDVLRITDALIAQERATGS